MRREQFKKVFNEVWKVNDTEGIKLTGDPLIANDKYIGEFVEQLMMNGVPVDSQIDEKTREVYEKRANLLTGPINQSDLQSIRNVAKTDLDDAAKRVTRDQDSQSYKLIEIKRADLDRKIVTAEYIENYLDQAKQAKIHNLYLAQCLKNKEKSSAAQALENVTKGDLARPPQFDPSAMVVVSDDEMNVEYKFQGWKKVESSSRTLSQVPETSSISVKREIAYFEMMKKTLKEEINEGLSDLELTKKRLDQVNETIHKKEVEFMEIAKIEASIYGQTQAVQDDFTEMVSNTGGSYEASFIGYNAKKGSVNTSSFKTYNHTIVAAASQQREAAKNVKRLSWASCFSSIKRSGDVMRNLLNSAENTDWVLAGEPPFSLTTNEGFHFFVDSALLVKNLAVFDSTGNQNESKLSMSVHEEFQTVSHPGFTVAYLFLKPMLPCPIWSGKDLGQPKSVDGNWSLSSDVVNE
eukprot:UN29958